MEKQCRNCKHYFGDYKKGRCTTAPGMGTGQNVLGGEWCGGFSPRQDGKRGYHSRHDGNTEEEIEQFEHWSDEFKNRFSGLLEEFSVEGGLDRERGE